MTTRPDWDVFCNVIDNYGDIGVCWRLARQLGANTVSVRLWVDDLKLQAAFVPRDPTLPLQTVQGVEVRRWESRFLSSHPHGW
jgi:hypothetical protein